jgi:hypothetical protein
MRRNSFWICPALLILLVGILPAVGFAQSEGSHAGRFGVQAKISTLGIGGEAAYELTHRINVRAGFNGYNFNHTLTKDGITYDAKLGLRSFTANADFYLLGPLHISPGALLYNGFKVTGNAAVAAGQTFSLGGVDYLSGAGNPLGGTLAMTVPKAAPEVLIGFGNLVPRSGRHLTFNFEMGAVFQGTLTSTLALTGLACPVVNGKTGPCVNAATDPTVQSNVAAQQTKLNNDLKPFKYYPVVSFGIGWHF